MACVNKVILLGRLGADPESRSFSNGGRVVNLRIATSERYKDRDGNAQERTEWHSVAIFAEPLGDIAEKYLRKGDQVYLEGKLETRKWQDQAGADRYSTEVVLRPFDGKIALIGGGGGARDGEGGGREERGGGARGGDARRERGSGGGGGGGGGGRGGGWDSRTGARARPTDIDDEIPFGPEFR
jgi:single-strand DNA-binding protein